MTGKERDTARYLFVDTMMQDINSLIDDKVMSEGEKSFSAHVLTASTDNKLAKEILGTLETVDLSHEEAIVAGMVALLRSSKLPQQAIQFAAIAYSSPESSDHRNRNYPHPRIPV